MSGLYWRSAVLNPHERRGTHLSFLFAPRHTSISDASHRLLHSTCAAIFSSQNLLAADKVQSALRLLIRLRGAGWQRLDRCNHVVDQP